MSDLQNLFGDSSTDLVTQLRTKHYNTINVIRKFLLGEIADIMEGITTVALALKNAAIVKVVADVQKSLQYFEFPAVIRYQEPPFATTHPILLKYQRKLHRSLWEIHARLHLMETSLPVTTEQGLREMGTRLKSAAMALASFRKGRIAEEKLAFKFNNNSNADGDASLSSSSSESSSSSSSSSRSLSTSSTTSSSSNVDDLPVGSVLNMQRVVKPTDNDNDDDNNDVKVDVVEKKSNEKKSKRNSRDNEREIAKPKQLWDKKQSKNKKNNSKSNNDNKNNNDTNNTNNDNDNNDKNKKDNEQNSKTTEKIDDSDDQSSESSIFVFPANAKTFSISKVETSTVQQAIPLKAQSIVIESVVLPSKKAQKAAVINVEEEKEKSKQYKDKSLDGLMDLI